MPIRVSCSCGKTLAVKDELAGKAVRCPACQKPVKVPAAGATSTGVQAGATPARTPAARPAAPPPSGGNLDDLFEEEGMTLRSGPTCPQCLTELKPGAVLCTRCGYHLQTGQRLAAHRTEAERTVLGHKSLDKAVEDMQKEKDLQQSLMGAGMPWWMLALVLFLVASAGILGVMSVNYMTGEEGAEGGAPNVPHMFFMLMFGAMAVTMSGAALIILFRAFKESIAQGLMVWLVPFYLFFYVFTRWQRVGRPFLVYIGAGLLAGGALAGAMATQ